MKLLSLNVALFETNNENLLKFLSSQKPDIVCLQEVALSSDPKVVKDYLSKDFILISQGVKVNSFEVLDSDVSDHLPLILDFCTTLY